MMLTRLPKFTLFCIIYFCSSYLLTAETQTEPTDRKLTIIKISRSYPGNPVNVYAFLEYLLPNTNSFENPEATEGLQLANIITSGNSLAHLIHSCTKEQFQLIEKNAPDSIKDINQSDILDLTKVIRKHSPENSQAVAFFDTKHSTFYLYSTEETKNLFIFRLKNDSEQYAASYIQSQLSLFSIPNTQANLKKKPEDIEQDDKSYHLTTYFHSTGDGGEQEQDFTTKNIKFNCAFNPYIETSYTAGYNDRRYISGFLDLSFKNKHFSTHYNAEVVASGGETKSLHLGISSDRKSIYILEIKNQLNNTFSYKILKDISISELPNLPSSKSKQKEIVLTLSKDEIKIIESKIKSLKAKDADLYDLTKYFSEHITDLQSVHYLAGNQTLQIQTTDNFAEAIQQLRKLRKNISVRANYKLHKFSNQAMIPKSTSELLDSTPVTIELSVEQSTQAVNSNEAKEFTTTTGNKTVVSITQNHFQTYPNRNTIFSSVNASYQLGSTQLKSEGISTTLSHKSRILPLCNIEGVSYVLEITPSIQPK